jgi:glucokinase
MGTRGLGIDVGGTNLRAALVELDTGAVIALRRHSLGDRSPQEVVAAAAGLVRSLGADAGTPLGVGFAGQLRGSTGVVMNAPNLGWRDVPRGEMLAGALGAPVRVVNDLSAAAWGEARFGAARGARDALVVFAGTGVGAGLLVGGRLHEGAAGVAGELGHVKVDRPAGAAPRRCGCGMTDCLEAWAGGAAVESLLREAAAAGCATAIAPSAGEVPERGGAGRIEAAARAGDPWARALWDGTAGLLGRAVASAVTLLDPGRVVLGGGLLLGNTLLYEMVERRIREETSRTAAAGLLVVRAALGDEAGVVGSALLAAGR